MANIYQKQGITQAAQGVSPGDYNIKVAKSVSEGMVEEGQKQYEKGLNLELQAQTTSSNEMMKTAYSDPNLSSNPQELGKEFDKIAQEYASALETEDQKIEYLADFELKKSSYLNQATANLQKVEAERAKSIAYDSVYSDIDAMGVAFGNGISGVYNEDDIVNFQLASQNMKANINRQNADGTYVFSDAQRRKMSKDMEDSIYNSFKNRFDLMEQSQKDSIAEAIASDSYNVVELEDGGVNIKDVMGEENYLKTKNFVQESKKREVDLEYKRMNLQKRQEQVAKYNTEMSLSAQLDDMEGEEALKVLDENQEVVGEKYYKAKQKAILSSMGIDANTQSEEYSNFLLDVSAINPDDARDFFDKSDDLMARIEESYAEGKLKLSDKINLINNLSKRQGKALPDLIKEESGWFKGYDYSDAYEELTSGLSSLSDVNDAMLRYDRAISSGDYSNEDKKMLVNTIKNEYKQTELNRAINGKTQEPQMIGGFKVRIK